VDKFFLVIKHIPNGFAEITRINKAKWKSFFDKLTLLSQQKIQQTAEVDGEPEDVTTVKKSGFSNLDFFKSTFFSENLDKEKVKNFFKQKEQAANDFALL